MNLTNVYVNVAGKGENVLKDGTGECDNAIITASGTVVGNGPQKDGTYVLGSSQKVYYDVTCIGFRNGYGSFNLRSGDSC